jgi:hypothetical protein
LIDRSVEEVYEFLSELRTQLRCWDVLSVADYEYLPYGTFSTEGIFSLGGKTYLCVVELYLTRPGSGVVTRLSWSNGEMAAEFRIMEEGGRTRVELNVEGMGGGIATTVHVRHSSQHILSRLKQQFDMA